MKKTNLRAAQLRVGASLLGVLLLAVSWTAAAVASNASPPSKKEAKKQTSTSGPDASLAGDVRRKKPKEEYRPQVEYDAFRFQLELQVADKRRAQMDTLKKIIALGSTDKEMPDLLFRYAELCWEESRYHFFEANRKDDDWLAAKQKDDQVGMSRATAEKEQLQKESQTWQAEAITRYRQIVKKYPTYQRMDEVLYFLGHNLWDDNNEKDALGIYKLLLTRYPQSKYVPDAYLAFGEYYFNNSKGQRDELRKALAAYKKAASYPENKVYLYALYKEGWCFFNLTDFPSALDMFKSVIQFAELQSSLSSGNKLKLAKDAIRDYVLAYSHYGSPLAAKADFQKVGGEENWWKMLTGLGDLYYDDGKDKEAILVYRDLIREKPLAPEAPLHQAKVVDASMRIGNKQYTAEQARALVKVLHDVETSGAAKSDAEKKKIADARDLAERTLSNLAVTWHNEGKKTRDDETFARANDVYADYLTIFPDSPKSYDLHFYHGELLFDNLQRYHEAGEEYDKVVAIDVQRIQDKTGKKKPGKWFQKATEDAVFAWEEVMKQAQAKAKPPDTNKGTAELPLPPEEQSMLRACETEAKYFPKGPSAVDVAYKAAQIYYRFNHFKDAARLFEQIVEDHPDNPLSTYSANLLLDIYNLTGDYQQVLESARKFLENPKLARQKTKEDVDFRDHLPSLIEQAGFKLVEGLEKRGQYGLAAQKYLAFVQEFPKNGNADLALWNAANDFGRAGDYQRAIDVRKQLVAEYGASKYAPRALHGNGELYEASADFADAAAAFEKYAAGYEHQIGLSDHGKAQHHKLLKVSNAPLPPPPEDIYDEQKAQEALINAAVYRDGLKQHAEAIRDRELYLKLWPIGKTHNQGDSQSEKVFASIADVQEEMGHLGAAAKQLEEHEGHVDRDPNSALTVKYKLAKIYEKMHNARLAHREYEEILDLGKHSNRKHLSPEAVDALGHASYELNEPTFDEFDRIKLRLPEKELVKSVKAKIKALSDVRRVYKETVELRAAEPAICALWKVATAEQRLAQALFDAPVPANLRANEQLEAAYKDALAQQALPIENAAKGDFKSALGQARELGVYDECSEKSFEALRKYEPQNYAELSEALAQVSINAPTVTPEGGLLTAVQPSMEAQSTAEEPKEAPKGEATPRASGEGPTAPMTASSSPQPSSDSPSPPSDSNSTTPAAPEPAEPKD